MRIIFFVSFLVLIFFYSCTFILAYENDFKSLREISLESKKPSTGREGRPLPLAAHWNRGQKPRGFGPGYQLQLLKQGHHILPWFHFNGPSSPALLFYYKDLIKYAAKFNLPISFVGTQWENLLSVDNKYFGLPRELNPNVVLINGTIIKTVSPFGSIEPWRQVGMEWTSQPLMNILQEWYPSPPLVLFVSNNEHSKLVWHDVEKSQRYMKIFGPGKSDEFKRQVVGDGWIHRYSALLSGMVDGLNAFTWKASARFIGYDAFFSDAFGRWGGWGKYSLHTQSRLEPWSSCWDGVSLPYYTHNWDLSVDFTAWSPQIRAMNQIFVLDEIYKSKPDYWFELSVWDGYEPGLDNDKRKYYEKLGQQYSPERYAGMVQFGMWLFRPRVVREYRSWIDTVENSGTYFMALVRAVDRVYDSKTLQRFWRHGRLIANSEVSHLHQSAIPIELKDKNRWFLLDTNLDPKKPWTLETEIPVFSIALSLGSKPDREWLIYAFAPLTDEREVKVQIPSYKQVAITAGQAGHFYLVQEQSNMIQRLE